MKHFQKKMDGRVKPGHDELGDAMRKPRGLSS
jgi:hypothetical protein